MKIDKSWFLNPIALSAILGTIFFCAGPAEAQPAPPNVIVRPAALIVIMRIQTNPVGRVPEEVCLVENGLDYLNPANHLVCVVVPAPGIDQIVEIPTNIPVAGGGNDVYIAVVTLTDLTGLVISEPSPNIATVLDLPLPAIHVPGPPQIGHLKGLGEVFVHRHEPKGPDA